MPAAGDDLWGHTISWNIIVPILVMPLSCGPSSSCFRSSKRGAPATSADHHLLQRPRDVPNRTALMAALMTFYGLAWSAGGNDIIATQLHLSINQITCFLRFAVLVGRCRVLGDPTLCLSLQHWDRERRVHGQESGVIDRSAAGGYTERHLPPQEPPPAGLSGRASDRGQGS